MAHSELKNLTVNIADKVFKIKIDAQSEPQLLENLKKINLKIKEFKTAYPYLHPQEYLGMVLIWMASENNSEEAELLNTMKNKIILWTENIKNELNDQDTTP